MKLLVALLFAVSVSYGQYDYKLVEDYQNNLIQFYADSTTTPLKSEELAAFTGIQFFPVNENFYVRATFKRTKNEVPFAMKTSGKKTPMYVKYGEISFKIANKKYKLDVFQNLDLVRNNPKYRNHLFLPFTDLTSGVTSYGGGRYLDLTIPEKKHFWLDFNKAYNPYCAYTLGYNCPIPPAQNDLEVAIEAGVKFDN
ncbi:DUF1684 domain-containing protein [Flavobacterium agricola]|uniref:DUF1684 domain-containing protein n=1 Tax=Flavobacterium agricola TaxID=2870839 RepID=A0ABY6M1V1_9FLAO|nr:DUF1684 domain-containing protein [Flavobacterium agricola]UYW02489.1 DUF1684 domain-containing protein [Flavobacterium agricola]